MAPRMPTRRSRAWFERRAAARKLSPAGCPPTSSPRTRRPDVRELLPSALLPDARSPPHRRPRRPRRGRPLPRRAHPGRAVRRAPRCDDHFVAVDADQILDEVEEFLTECGAAPLARAPRSSPGDAARHGGRRFDDDGRRARRRCLARRSSSATARSFAASWPGSAVMSATRRATGPWPRSTARRARSAARRRSCARSRPLGVDVRAGVHTGEVRGAKAIASAASRVQIADARRRRGRARRGARVPDRRRPRRRLRARIRRPRETGARRRPRRMAPAGGRRRGSWRRSGLRPDLALAARAPPGPVGDLGCTRPCITGP